MLDSNNIKIFCFANILHKNINKIIFIIDIFNFYIEYRIYYKIILYRINIFIKSFLILIIN